MGEYNDEKDIIKCKKCLKGTYSNILGAIYCELCPENYTSLFGASQCDLCEDIIPHCNFCGNNGICLQCNNKAVEGYDNCQTCENEED